MSQEEFNILTMIGCNKDLFQSILDKAVGKVTLSSGSYYSDYYLMDSKYKGGFLAVFDYKGNVKQIRNNTF